ncbi:MAG: hypothetical protein IIY75_09335 [Erysipelotrichales bacterium]|nr:hypothetical protein [Erysipelotrichales bacterium]
MVKHGGGYLILDVSDNQIDGVSGNIILTEEQIGTIDVAVKQRIPILYVGPTYSNSDGGLRPTVMTAAFIYAYRDVSGSGKNTISFPIASEYEIGSIPMRIEDGELIPNLV